MFDYEKRYVQGPRQYVSFRLLEWYTQATKSFDDGGLIHVHRLYVGTSCAQIRRQVH